MIDIATVEEYMRAANPIPNLDALDADELAFAVAAVETRRTVAMQAPTQHPTQSTTVTPPPQRRRSVWAFAAAFILILVVVGGAALLLRSDDTQVTNEPAPTTTVAEETTASFEVESLIWSRVPLGQDVVGVPRDKDMTTADSGFEIASIATGGPGFVAVGKANGPVSEGWPEDAAVWTSPDGTAWTRLPPSVEVFGGPGLQLMEDVTAGGPGLVAVGFGWDEPEMAGRTAIVWTSVDGSAWSRVPYQDAFASPGYEGNSTAMHSVTAGGPGLVAVGRDSRVAAVWTSTDGVTWTRAPHNPEAFGTGKVLESATDMSEVAAGGPGLVAIGTSGMGARSWGRGDVDWTHEPGAEHAVVWTSVDGITWSRVPHDEAVFGGAEGQHCRMRSLAVGDSSLVAIGSCEQYTIESGKEDGLVSHGDQLVTWTSPDAISWSRVSLDETVFRAGDEISTVTAVGSEFVATGSGVWTSPDGITWSRLDGAALPTADAMGIRSVAVGSRGLVAVGEVDGLIAVWTATPGG
jgi:hypothetical protein